MVMVKIVDSTGGEAVYEECGNNQYRRFHQPSTEFTFGLDLLNHVRFLIREVGADRKITCIKIISGFTGYGLRESKILFELANSTMDETY